MSPEGLLSLLIIASCAMLGLLALFAHLLDDPMPEEEVVDHWARRRTKPRYYVNGSALDDAMEASFRQKERVRREREQRLRADPPQASWSKVLGVEPSAGEREIRRAYATLMRGLHPDVVGNNDRTSALCEQVNVAYRKARADAQDNGRL